MKPSQIDHTQGRLFESRLSDQLNPNHELIHLARQIDWVNWDKECSDIFTDNSLGGQPPKPVRLIIGLIMLQHTYNLSDKEVIYLWPENPYWQHFCGFDYLQWEKPIDPSSLAHWKKRLGDDLIEKILKEKDFVDFLNKGSQKSHFKKIISWLFNKINNS